MQKVIILNCIPGKLAGFANSLENIRLKNRQKHLKRRKLAEEVVFFTVCMKEKEEKKKGRKVGRKKHSLQSCEKSLVGGKWKVEEVGLVTMTGAEVIPLDTTEDAGTWRARKSALGLVGSSVGRGGGKEREAEEGMGLGVSGR